jgi:adenosylmethionine-8-amino-7-oxononanoate aminotransferase
MLTQPAPLPIVKAEGVFLYTEDGRRILDGISSWWVNIHGHSHPKLNEALAAQAREVDHVPFAGCTHRPAVELAEKLLARLPSGLTRIFYSDNGSITLHHAYHGDTVGSMSASEDSIFTRGFRPLLFPVRRVHAPYCYRCPLGLERATCRVDCLDDLRAALAEHRESVAAVLVEPMLQGAGGMIVWPREFLAGVRRLCDAYGALMIADEVLTGFGRTGRFFACEHAPVAPDIICLSKAITAGYLPLGATAVTEAIYDAFLSEDREKTFFHGHSYTANPQACAVASASLDLFDEYGALERVRALERQLGDGLEPLRALPHVGDVRVIGGVGIVELVADKTTKTAGGYLDRMGPKLAAAFLERNLLLRPLGNIIYFMPPYVISEADTRWALEQIATVLEGVHIVGGA